MSSALLPDCNACAAHGTRLAKIRLLYISPSIYAGPRHIVGRFRAANADANASASALFTSAADETTEVTAEGVSADQPSPAEAPSSLHALLVHSAGHVIASVDAIESGETVLIPIERRFSNQDTIMATLVNTWMPACAITDLITLTVPGCIAAHAEIPTRCHGASNTDRDPDTAADGRSIGRVSSIEIGDEFANGLFRIHGYSGHGLGFDHLSRHPTATRTSCDLGGVLWCTCVSHPEQCLQPAVVTA